MDSLKFKLTIAYDGAAYQGWQIQKVGTGVQEKVEEAIGKLFRSKPRLHSSSRTDTGVHALGMVAHFEFRARNLDMCDHPQRVNARVRAAGAVNSFHTREKFAQRLLDFLLHAHAGFLHLPALIRRAVVGDGEFEFESVHWISNHE